MVTHFHQARPLVDLFIYTLDLASETSTYSDYGPLRWNNKLDIVGGSFRKCSYDFMIFHALWSNQAPYLQIDWINHHRDLVEAQEHPGHAATEISWRSAQSQWSAGIWSLATASDGDVRQWYFMWLFKSRTKQRIMFQNVSKRLKNMIPENKARFQFQ